MNDMNIDKNTMDNIKNMIDNGNINDALSHISPEMIQNFSKMLGNQNGSSQAGTNESINKNTEQYTNTNQNSNNTNTENNNTNENSNNGFDLSGIDMNTIMKMSSMFGKMNGNNKNDPRANLLNSLKPYLRNGKKDKLNNYMNLLNVTKIADVMKNANINNDNNKENKDV